MSKTSNAIVRDADEHAPDNAAELARLRGIFADLRQFRAWGAEAEALMRETPFNGERADWLLDNMEAAWHRLPEEIRDLLREAGDGRELARLRAENAELRRQLDEAFDEGAEAAREGTDP